MNPPVANSLLVDEPPRSVKPRTRTFKRLPVVVMHGDDALTEDGEIIPVRTLIESLPLMPPTLFARIGAADWIGYLNTLFVLRDPDHWQWRATVHERDICRPDGVIVASRVSTLIHYFGFQEGNYAGGKRVYHKIIDPVSMYGRALDEVYPGTEPTLERLQKWAITIRDFCAESGIEVRPTTGGISAQWLTDKRFYPKARRKTPAKINSRVREELPGNYYLLKVYPGHTKEFTAHYLDQHRAHHYHARTVHLPSANHLYAHGRFVDLAECVFENISPGFSGLYCLDLRPPQLHDQYYWLSGYKKVFVYSNELQHLLDSGYKVLGVRAAWGSHIQDTGLAKYATWAESQLDRYGDAPWLKPLLLATYGTLATRPKYAESVFRLASKGGAVTLRTGHHRLNGRHTKSRVKLEPRIANVLHRGMIEAATRSESIGLAQYLTYKSFRVLSIYADAVMVENDDQPLPLLPEPWRCKETLNHLQFINQQAFISGEMTKLPGVNREILKHRQQSPGVAPRTMQGWDALTGEKVYRQIGQKEWHAAEKKDSPSAPHTPTHGSL